jgi:hypothetical protein
MRVELVDRMILSAIGGCLLVLAYRWLERRVRWF